MVLKCFHFLQSRIVAKTRHSVGRGRIRTSVPNRSLASFSATPPNYAKKLVKVPGMGDSITEGTIVEWIVGVGQPVKEGDVVALIETDKVTVDIKAEVDGVLTQQFGSVDENVLVGSELYELDTEGVADDSQQATKVVETDSSNESAAVAAETAVASGSLTSVPLGAGGARKPLIQFLGKEGWKGKLSGEAPKTQHPAPIMPSTPNGAITLDGSNITSMYGRPMFTEKEMEALIMGGANVAPSVVSTSEGATFK